jgi:kumamolisin
MTPLSKKIELQSSERAPIPGSHRVGPADANEMIEVSVFLRRRSKASGNFPRMEELGRMPIRERQYLTHDEFRSKHGARSEDFAQIRSFAEAHGLRVETESVPRRSVVLAGTVSAFSRAFDVELARYSSPHGEYRGRTGKLSIPSDLAEIIECIVGLDNRPQAAPHFRRRQQAAAARSYTPRQVAQAYDFPADLNGAGQCIGILELGGGYSEKDLNTFFGKLGIATPSVTAVSVDGGQNTPAGDPNSADGEVALDIEVAGSVAPGAKIAVYFTPNTDRGFLDALTTAIHDTANKPSVISISWGGPESTWTQQAMSAFDAACQDAATLGITVCVAAGDNGATDGVKDGHLHVDFPASVPSVIACGGTFLEATGNRIQNEETWNDLPSGGATGGGVSQVFPLPSWQGDASVPASPNGKPGRGVPDVAGDAHPNSGYDVVVDGQSDVIGGTSAVAPLWAGLIAVMNQHLPHTLGLVNPLLYNSTEMATFHDITKGNNGGYKAGRGWDPCTGLGTPNGVALLAVLASPAAATAQSAQAT